MQHTTTRHTTIYPSTVADWAACVRVCVCVCLWRRRPIYHVLFCSGRWMRRRPAGRSRSETLLCSDHIANGIAAKIILSFGGRCVFFVDFYYYFSYFFIRTNRLQWQLACAHVWFHLYIFSSLNNKKKEKKMTI